VVTTLLVIGEHLLLGGIQPAARGNRVARHVHAHLAILLGCIVLLKAWGYRLDQFSLVFSPLGVVTGASYTDVHAQLPALRLLVLVAPVCAVLFFLNVRSRDFTLPVAGTLLLGLSSLLVGGLYPWFVQRFQVTPQELQREERYIQRNIHATRKAFALEGVQTGDFAAAEDLTAAEVRANPTTVDNIRLWEADVLKTAIQNLQAIGQYYEFSDVDVDRYRIGGAVRQVMISAREVDPRNLDASAQTWVNLTLAYTHGYGVVAAQVNRAETSGRPDFVVSGFDQEQAAIPVRQPRIYFGEPPPDTPSYVVVGSRQPEVGSPSVSGQGQASFIYDGRGGVRLSSSAGPGGLLVAPSWDLLAPVEQGRGAQRALHELLPEQPAARLAAGGARDGIPGDLQDQDPRGPAGLAAELACGRLHPRSPLAFDHRRDGVQPVEPSEHHHHAADGHARDRREPRLDILRVDAAPPDFGAVAHAPQDEQLPVQHEAGVAGVEPSPQEPGLAADLCALISPGHPGSGCDDLPQAALTERGAVGVGDGEPDARQGPSAADQPIVPPPASGGIKAAALQDPDGVAEP
jgi:Uncharacterised protein family (UPF0182)